FQFMKQAELDIEKVHKVRVDYNVKQLQAPIKVEAIKNATFIESPVKQSLLERLMKKEQLVYYELHVPNWDDHLLYEWHYRFALEVKKFMQEVGLGEKWNMILPHTMDMSPPHILDKEEVEWLNLLPDPDWCLRIVNEVDQLEE